MVYLTLSHRRELDVGSRERTHWERVFCVDLMRDNARVLVRVQRPQYYHYLFAHLSLLMRVCVYVCAVRVFVIVTGFFFSFVMRSVLTLFPMQ